MNISWIRVFRLCIFRSYLKQLYILYNRFTALKYYHERFFWRFNFHLSFTACRPHPMTTINLVNYSNFLHKCSQWTYSLIIKLIIIWIYLCVFSSIVHFLKRNDTRESFWLIKMSNGMFLCQKMAKLIQLLFTEWNTLK